MDLNINYSQKAITEKQALLKNAEKILKQEFIGIDTVIDSVAASINTWYLFPELQERPLVINLWGMTGVGKTALITRLATLLNFENRFFRYDMGSTSQYESDMGFLLQRNMANNGVPYMIMLDEFQYAKTKSEDNREVANNFSRDVWEILDSGKFKISRFVDRDIEKMTIWRKVLSDCLLEGVEVMNGVVIRNENIFVELLCQLDDYLGIQVQLEARDSKKEKVARFFLPDELYKLMYDYMPARIDNIIQMKRLVQKLDGIKIIELITKAIESAKSNKWIDCRSEEHT